MSSERSGWSFPTNFFCDRLRFKKLLLKIIIAKFLQQLNPCIAILKKFAERKAGHLSYSTILDFTMAFLQNL